MSDQIPVYRPTDQWPVETAAKICPVFRHLTGAPVVDPELHCADCAVHDGRECDCF